MSLPLARAARLTFYCQVGPHAGFQASLLNQIKDSSVQKIYLREKIQYESIYNHIQTKVELPMNLFKQFKENLVERIRRFTNKEADNQTNKNRYTDKNSRTKLSIAVYEDKCLHPSLSAGQKCS